MKIMIYLVKSFKATGFAAEYSYDTWRIEISKTSTCIFFSLSVFGLIKLNKA